MAWLGFLMIFISIALLVGTICIIITSRKSTIMKRLDTISGEYNDRALEEAVLSQNDLKKQSKYKKGRAYKGIFDKYLSKIEMELAKTDLLVKPREYLIMVCCFALVIGLLFYVATKKIIMVILGIVFVILAARVFINIKKKRRNMKFNQQLVDTITLISNGLKAGYSFFQSAEIVAREMRPPMSTEFKKMIKQMNMGIPTDEALRRLNERVESQDMDLIITAILIQRQIGGNLSEVLDQITDTIQGRIKLKRDINVKTAQGRISGIILMMLVPGLTFIIYILNPEFMKTLFTEPLGWIMIGMAVFLQVIGIYSLRKILHIDV